MLRQRIDKLLCKFIKGTPQVPAKSRLIISLSTKATKASQIRRLHTF